MKVGRSTATVEEDSGSSCASALPAKNAEAHRAGAIAELNRMVGNGERKRKEGMKGVDKKVESLLLRRKGSNCQSTVWRIYLNVPVSKQGVLYSNIVLRLIRSNGSEPRRRWDGQNATLAVTEPRG